ncbi:uncharacterized protein [Dysidea avara]|uniref:uncharacterized protein n=1 Tax=Dysidea avara TaxID=196820 RepID=UPI003319DD3D
MMTTGKVNITVDTSTSPTRNVATLIYVICCHSDNCCNTSLSKGIMEAFIDYNKVSTHMIKAAAGQEHRHTNYNCDVTVTLKSSTSSVKKTNDAMATGGMYKTNLY